MSEKPVKIAKLRRDVLAGRQVDMEKHTKEIIPLERDITPLMRVKELEFGEPIERLVAKKRGSIYKVAKRLGVHPSTVYLWRKRLLIE